MNQIKLNYRVWQDPAYFIAFGFGSGLLPWAPGTWGTLAAIPLYLLLWDLNWVAYVLVILAAFILGVYVSDRVTKELGVHDYKGIVWDEVVGYLLTMLLVPHGLGWIVLGFVLFRVFDIWKPFPIGVLDRSIKGGLGIMLDDVAAAVPSSLILHLLAWSVT
jgi:phosphatidylglycerophosphatase A